MHSAHLFRCYVRTALSILIRRANDSRRGVWSVVEQNARLTIVRGNNLHNRRRNTVRRTCANKVALYMPRINTFESPQRVARHAHSCWHGVHVTACRVGMSSRGQKSLHVLLSVRRSPWVRFRPLLDRPAPPSSQGHFTVRGI